MNEVNKSQNKKHWHIIIYVSTAFFAIYGGLSLIYLATNKYLFQGYGLFTNDQPYLYMLVVSLFSLFFVFFAFISSTKSIVKDFRLLIPNALKNIIFIFYVLVFIYACIDYVNRYSLFSLSLNIANINASMSQLGYDVAHSDGKLSYTLISLFPFLLLFYSYDKNKRIKIFSFFLFSISLFILFIFGRKVQLLAAILALVFRFKITRNIKVITFAGLPLLIFLVYFMNSVRGGLSSESFFYVLFQSQESYPLALGAYLFVNPLDVPLDTLFNSTMPYTIFVNMPTITGVINQQLFKTHEYGPVYSVLGFSYYYFPISFFILFFIIRALSLKVNTLLSWGGEYTPFVVFYCIKLFIFLRNGYLNFFTWDIIFSLAMFSLCLFFKYKEGK